MTDEYLTNVAIGLYALRSDLWKNPRDGWKRLPEREQAKYLAHARFVLSYADSSAFQAGRS